MGLSCDLGPTEEGKIMVILLSAVLSICVVKDIFLSMLHFVGIHIASATEHSIESLNLNGRRRSSFKTYIPAVRFNTLIKSEQEECSVCITKFEPEAEVNNLRCGHVFHKLCLEKWLKYWRVTCPNCRTRVMPPEEDR